MDGVSAVSASTMAIAASGTSAVALSVLRDTEQLPQTEINELFGSLGLGTNVNAIC